MKPPADNGSGGGGGEPISLNSRLLGFVFAGGGETAAAEMPGISAGVAANGSTGSSSLKV